MEEITLGALCLVARRRLHTRRVVQTVALGLLLLWFAIVQAGPWIWRAYYRVDHLELVLSAAQRYHVSPYRVGAVIFTESRFRENARSEVGAVGLMQLMPETAAEMAEEIGMQSYSLSQLERPEVNIELGVAYLSVLEERFPNETHMLAAYNAGPTLVAQWAKDGIAIPYPETREFVLSVQRHEERLARLFPKWNTP